MSKKNKKKEKNLASKPLRLTQVGLLTLLVQQFNQVNALWNQKKQAIDDAVITCIREEGIPETQVGEWGLGENGKTIVRYGKKRRPPIMGTTVRNRPKKKKKPGKDQPAEPPE